MNRKYEIINVFSVTTFKVQSFWLTYMNLGMSFNPYILICDRSDQVNFTDECLFHTTYLKHDQSTSKQFNMITNCNLFIVIVTPVVDHHKTVWYLRIAFALVSIIRFLYLDSTYKYTTQLLTFQ